MKFYKVKLQVIKMNFKDIHIYNKTRKIKIIYKY